jgi:hypothetical protein
MLNELEKKRFDIANYIHLFNICRYYLGNIDLQIKTYIENNKMAGDILNFDDLLDVELNLENFQNLQDVKELKKIMNRYIHDDIDKYIYLKNKTY